MRSPARPGSRRLPRHRAICRAGSSPPSGRSSRSPPAALVTTAGFKYLLEIGRHDIPRHGNLYGWSKPARPVPPDRVLEVAERLDAEGTVLTALDEDRAGGGRRVPPRVRQPRPRAAHAGDPRRGVSGPARLALLGGAAAVP